MNSKKKENIPLKVVTSAGGTVLFCFVFWFPYLDTRCYKFQGFSSIKTCDLRKVRKVPHECPMAVTSASTVCLHVILGLPRFLRPSGFHSTATLGMEL